MINLPNEFKIRMEALLQTEYDAFIDSYSKPAHRGLRVNTLRTSPEDFMGLPVAAKWGLKKSNILNEGFIIESENGEREAGKHPYHMAGAYYIQEPSAMCVAAELRNYNFTENTRVLDLCAAPGGKSGAIAAYMNGKGILVSNEIVKKRAEELAKNIERLGIINAIVTNAAPEKIADSLSGYFDIVIVDAPCSGEGMFRKNPAAIQEWSPEHVSACAKRQSLILNTAVRCVAPEGILVYSTCTFSAEENEKVIDAFINEHDFEVLSMKRLFPHTCDGEGHFVCVMKNRSHIITSTLHKENAKKQKKPAYKPCSDKAFKDFMSNTFITPPNLRAYINDGGKVLLTNNEMLDIASELSCISCGIHVGYVKGYFEPSHSLFMAAHGGKYRLVHNFPPDSKELISFLSGESICDEKYEGEKGFCLITTDGFPLGFCKITESTLKNKLPKGLRLP